MIAFTSVTFRQKTLAEIFDTAERLAVPALELGCDVHVPNDEACRQASRLSGQTGVRVRSLGSYYRAGDDEPVEFDRLLTMAKTVGAENIRIWAGGQSSETADRAYFDASVRAAALAARKGASEGVRVSLEFHENTLNDSFSACRRYLEAADEPNLKTYWQPLFAGADDENLNGVLPALSHVHVFHWRNYHDRHALSDGASDWLRWIARLKRAGFDGMYIMEFVRGDSETQFRQDLTVLRRWVYGHGTDQSAVAGLL